MSGKKPFRSNRTLQPFALRGFKMRRGVSEEEELKLEYVKSIAIEWTQVCAKIKIELTGTPTESKCSSLEHSN